MSNAKQCPTDVVLPLGATAEKNTCGSCAHFSRRPDEWQYNGRCTLELPPQYARKPWNAESTPTNSVQDTGSCGLWVDSGKSFIVSRRVP
jgi:hypothetical protein